MRGASPGREGRGEASAVWRFTRCLREDAGGPAAREGRRAVDQFCRKERSTMATLTPDAPANESKPPAKKRERVKRHRGARTEESGARYFLVKASSADRM